MLDFFHELKELILTLEAEAIDYALCGVALAIHGAPRATQDIDLLVRPVDIDRLRQVAHSRGFTLDSLPMDIASGVTIRRFTKLIDGQPFMLDALLVNPALEAVWVGRLTAPFEGGVVRVVSREGLISLKLASGRPQDMADIKRLEEVGRG